MGLIVKLVEWLAGLFGISLPAVALFAGLLGSVPVAWGSWKLGHWWGYSAGYDAGADKVQKQCEENDRLRKNAEIQRDQEAATENAADAEQYRQEDARNVQEAEAHIQQLEAELRSRPLPPPLVLTVPGRTKPAAAPSAGCSFTDDDLGSLQQNHFGRGKSGPKRH